MAPSLSSTEPHLRPRHVSLSLADMHTARHLNPVDGLVGQSTTSVAALDDSETVGLGVVPWPVQSLPLGCTASA